MGYLRRVGAANSLKISLRSSLEFEGYTHTFLVCNNAREEAGYRNLDVKGHVIRVRLLP